MAGLVEVESLFALAPALVVRPPERHAEAIVVIAAAADEALAVGDELQPRIARAGVHGLALGGRKGLPLAACVVVPVAGHARVFGWPRRRWFRRRLRRLSAQVSRDTRRVAVTASTHHRGRCLLCRSATCRRGHRC